MLKRRLDDARAAVAIQVDGKALEARSGDTLAGALIAAGVSPFRMTPVGGKPRSAYCMMGVCFDCLVTVDGVANRQACLVPVREGMDVVTGRGKRSIGR